MAEYYLISQLPSLDVVSDNSPLPITEERFQELCGNFLKKRLLNEIDGLTLVPPIDPDKSKSALVDAWNAGERDLRLALCRARAAKLNKVFDGPDRILPAEMIKAADAAVETESPMEAELFLSRCRLNFLETLRPADPFSDDFLLYYGLKLKLLLRIRKFDAQKGEEAYKSIYNSIILNGNKSEDKQ